MVGIALTIAGSDSGGGAGIQADLKSFSAMGIYGASVITAVTAQNTKAVTAIHPIPDQVVGEQIQTVLSDIKVDAIKIGMLGTPSLIKTVADALTGFEGPIVLDPVMIAKSGAVLLEDSAMDALKTHLFPCATLVTPNLPEAAKLLGRAQQSEEDLLEQAEGLKALGAKAVLIKGGHGSGQTCTDWLLAGGTQQSFDAARIDTRNTHGTGCSYSSAIAGCLAKGMALGDAVGTAHAWLHASIKRADELNVGQGHGPIHHFHALWA
ncbi:MAG: bifunctional hydroxymethylpyrimidine kinase/phosphomethylpyrimidine kinase [Pseudomonadota bacterium]